MFYKIFIEDISSSEFMYKAVEYSENIKVDISEALEILTDFELDELLYDI